MCDENHPFVLDKRFLVRRGKNVAIPQITDPMNDVRVIERGELADGRLVENHTLSDTNSFPESLRTLPDLPSK